MQSTECDRIVNSGFVSKDYLQPEIRDEFYVDITRKKIWLLALDLLNQFDLVCRKYELKYYLMFGSLLGAVRHNGFIPWDDDVDVAMPREDYEKLINLGMEFREPYFLQTPYSDNGYYQSFIKLRNSNTTFASESFKYQKMNQGMSLDIFPLDNWIEEDEGKQLHEKIKKLILDNSTYMRMSHPNPSSSDAERIKSYSGQNPLETYESIQKIATKYNNIDSHISSIAVCTIYDYAKNIFYSEDFQSTILCKFENLNLPIPSGYDRILKTIYGDYMKYPSLSERGKWHKGLIINPDVPYSDFLE